MLKTAEMKTRFLQKIVLNGYSMQLSCKNVILQMFSSKSMNTILRSQNRLYFLSMTIYDL